MRLAATRNSGCFHDDACSCFDELERLRAERDKFEDAYCHSALREVQFEHERDAWRAYAEALEKVAPRREGDQRAVYLALRPQW